MRSDARAPERGFTLLEIVCTLVILGVLGSLVFSGFGTAITGYTQMRESERRTCRPNWLSSAPERACGSRRFSRITFQRQPFRHIHEDGWHADNHQLRRYRKQAAHRRPNTPLGRGIMPFHNERGRPLLHRHRADPATRRTASHLDAFRRPPQHPPRQGLRFPMQTSQRGSVLLTIIGGIVILALLGMVAVSRS